MVLRCLAGRGADPKEQKMQKSHSGCEMMHVADIYVITFVAGNDHNVNPITAMRLEGVMQV